MQGNISAQNLIAGKPERKNVTSTKQRDPSVE
jgi:hypothetical protein